MTHVNFGFIDCLHILLNIVIDGTPMGHQATNVHCTVFIFHRCIHRSQCIKLRYVRAVASNEVRWAQNTTNVLYSKSYSTSDTDSTVYTANTVRVMHTANTAHAYMSTQYWKY